MNTLWREELEELIAADEKLIGQTFRLLKQGITNPKEIVALGAAGNVGVVSNNKAIIQTILENKIPNSSHISRFSYRAVNRLLSNNPEMSSELRDYLSSLRTALIERANSAEAAQVDVDAVLASSEALAKRADQITNAVYVYSFPTYLHYGTIEDPDVRWLKIGSTTNAVWKRILDQNRQTSMPEDPVLLRIYHSDNMDAAAVEHKFHDALTRIGHERSAATKTRAGKEWFATTEDAIDVFAEFLGLTIESDFAL